MRTIELLNTALDLLEQNTQEKITYKVSVSRDITTFELSKDELVFASSSGTSLQVDEFIEQVVVRILSTGINGLKLSFEQSKQAEDERLKAAAVESAIITTKEAHPVSEDTQAATTAPE